jgi:hypothetical protein
VITLALGPETEVIAHQNVICTKAFDQHLAGKFLGTHLTQGLIEGQDHALVDATRLKLDEFVPQGGYPMWRKVCPLVQMCKKITGMRLEGEHATGQTAMPCFGTQQSQHGLVPTVNTVKTANGQGHGVCHVRMLKTAKDAHGGFKKSIVTKNGYIVSDTRKSDVRACHLWRFVQRMGGEG